MNLVFKDKNQTGDADSPILYKDLRVNDGTLFCIDFSNRGMLVDFDLSKGIYDLADGVPLKDEENIVMDASIRTSSSTAIFPTLTPRRGMPMTFLGNVDFGSYNSGILIKGVGQYLYDKQPKSLILTWVSRDSSITNTAGQRFARASAIENNGGNNPYNIAFYIPGDGTGNQLSLAFATKSSFVNYNIGEDTPIQMAIEYVSPTEPCRLFVNGTYIGTGSQVEGSFGEPTNDDVLAVGGIAVNSSVRQPIDLYHLSLHDLSLTGMTADELVAMDYEYVNGIGRFEGLPTRRPYANLSV